MAEYWKSTPKYWCKFCKTHIRDTKFERQQHEATGRHQIAIQRSLRELHREREREDREKQRARDEVARLNGVVGSSGSATAATTRGAGAGGRQAVGGAREPKRQATVEERKKQLAQLAAMGVAVPDEYRGEMAMVGEWQTVAVKPVGEQQGDTNDASGTLNAGVRKRKKDGDDEEEDEGGAQRPKRGWGNTFKTYSSTAKSAATEDDIEALLSTARKPVVKKEESAEDADVKPDPDAPGAEASTAEHDSKPALKTEEADTADVKPDPEASDAASGAKLADIPPVKTEDDEKSADAGVVFKKRKSKALRQK